MWEGEHGMDPRCVLAVNWIRSEVRLRVSQDLCELGPAQFVGAVSVHIHRTHVLRGQHGQ